MTHPRVPINIDNMPILGEDVVISGEHFRSLLIKLAFGAPGAIADDVSTATPLPVTVIGGGGGGGAVTIADGADVAEGATGDAAVLGDTAGTVSAKLRGLSKIFNDVWDSVGGRLIVDGSEVTQPVSGTVTANAGTGTFVVGDGGGSLTVDGTVTANAGTGTFVVGDGGGSLTVDGTVTANAGTGTFIVGDGGGSLTVDGTVTANAGTGTFTTQDTASKVDDAAFAPATDRVLMFGAEFDDTAPDSVDEGDAGALRMSGRRELYTQIRDAAGNERGANVTATNALVVDGSAVTQPVSQATASSLNAQVVGNIAHDAVDSGNPVKIGGKASSTGAPPTAVAVNDRVDAFFDENGRLVVYLGTALSSSIDSVLVRPDVVGTHANAWSAAATGAGGTSAAIDLRYVSHMSAFGNVSGATTLTLQYSQDSTNWYDGSTTVVGGGGADFRIDATTGARYHRLKSSANVTATATIAGK